ncbi:hypothetical protein [Niabella beijingensis]|uniref:hypothetical protein n=1 Tax=Niabella beijingensis TaxID=2872700 RepID=UPI001CBE12CF|nr:hypothetical protein [Niabella beijingensis]MBZ4188941.1 hypothetical protein [Niabella beijingensis]
MKTASIGLLILIFPFACNYSKSNKASVAGTYVRTVESDIYTLHDTVSFSPVGKKGSDVYRINQRSQTLFKKEVEQKFNKRANHSMTGTFDAEKNIMHTGDPGILYSFDGKGGSVVVNGIEYRKIN